MNCHSTPSLAMSIESCLLTSNGSMSARNTHLSKCLMRLHFVHFCIISFFIEASCEVEYDVLVEPRWLTLKRDEPFQRVVAQTTERDGVLVLPEEPTGVDVMVGVPPAGGVWKVARWANSSALAHQQTPITKHSSHHPTYCFSFSTSCLHFSTEQALQ